MKDARGNKIKKGDILLEFNRGGKNFGKYQQGVLFWEVPKKFNFRQGINYNLYGEKYLFSFVDIKRSIKVNIDEMPKNFLYYFTHGLSDIYCSKTATNVKDAITNSDWKKQIKELNKHRKLLGL